MEKKNNLFDGVIDTLFWIGLYKDFNSALRNIPGLLFNTCNDNNPCLNYKFKLYDKIVIFNSYITIYIFVINLLRAPFFFDTFRVQSLQLKAHISQAALTETCFTKYGQLNLMARVIFNGHSMTTKVCSK